MAEQHGFSDIRTALDETLSMMEETDETDTYAIGMKIAAALQAHCEYPITLQGSLAKGTALPGDCDIDLFITVPLEDDTPSLTKTVIVNTIAETVIRKAKVAGVEVEGEKPKQASHPYICGTFEGVKFDLVPCFDATGIVTAVDRTPRHTAYMNKHLSDEQRRDVKLLKLLLKEEGLYGADTWTQGYSGYALECAVAETGSFGAAISHLASMQPLLDPVDVDRDVLASVGTTVWSTFLRSVHSWRRGEYHDHYFAPHGNATVLVQLGEAETAEEAASIRAKFYSEIRQAESIKYAPFFIPARACFKRGTMVYGFAEYEPKPTFRAFQGPAASRFPEGHEAFVAKYSGRRDALVSINTDLVSGEQYAYVCMKEEHSYLSDYLIDKGYDVVADRWESMAMFESDISRTQL